MATIARNVLAVPAVADRTEAWYTVDKAPFASVYASRTRSGAGADGRLGGAAEAPPGAQHVQNPYRSTRTIGGQGIPR